MGKGNGDNGNDELKEHLESVLKKLDVRVIMGDGSSGRTDNDSSSNSSGGGGDSGGGDSNNTGDSGAGAVAAAAVAEVKAETVDSVHAVNKLAGTDTSKLGAEDVHCVLQHHPSVRSIRHSHLVPQGLWTKYHSSKDSGRSYGFTVGASNVVPGLDEAISTMRVGE